MTQPLPATVRIKGLRELRRAVRDAPKEIQKALREELKGVGSIAAKLAVARAPRDTGKLAGSIRVRPLARGVLVGSPLIYAPVLEFGKRSEQRSRSGKTYIRTLRPQPWLLPAIEEASADIEREILPAIQRGLDRQFGMGGVAPSG